MKKVKTAVEQDLKKLSRALGPSAETQRPGITKLQANASGDALWTNAYAAGRVEDFYQGQDVEATDLGGSLDGILANALEADGLIEHLDSVKMKNVAQIFHKAKVDAVRITFTDEAIKFEPETRNGNNDKDFIYVDAVLKRDTNSKLESAKLDEPFEVSVNPDYLVQGMMLFDKLNAKSVKMNFASNIRPLVFTGEIGIPSSEMLGKEVNYLIMPIRTN